MRASSDRRPGPLEVQAREKSRVARIAPKRVHLWIDLQIAHPLRASLITVFKRREGLVSLAERGTDGSSIVAGNKPRRLLADTIHRGGCDHWVTCECLGSR